MPHSKQLLARRKNAEIGAVSIRQAHAGVKQSVVIDAERVESVDSQHPTVKRHPIEKDSDGLPSSTIAFANERITSNPATPFKTLESLFFQDGREAVPDFTTKGPLSSMC